MKTAGFWFALACFGPLIGWFAEEWRLSTSAQLESLGLVVMIAWSGCCIARAVTFLNLD